MTNENKSDSGSNPLLSLFGTPAASTPADPAALAAALDSAFGPATESPVGAGYQFTIDELATMDTDRIAALRGRADALMARGDKYVLATGEEVRSVLDALDSKMKADDRLSGFELAGVRNYVRSVMLTLRANPEYETILLDADIRNIVGFAQAAYADAAQMAGIAALKTTIRSTPASVAKKVAKSKVSESMAAAMAQSLDGFFKGGE